MWNGSTHRRHSRLDRESCNALFNGKGHSRPDRESYNDYYLTMGVDSRFRGNDRRSMGMTTPSTVIPSLTGNLTMLYLTEKVIPDLIGNLAMLYLTEKVIPDLIGNLAMIIT